MGKTLTPRAARPVGAASALSPFPRQQWSALALAAGRQLGSAAHPEAGVEVADVAIDGLGSDAQLDRDLVVRAARGEPAQYRQLPRRQGSTGAAIDVTGTERGSTGGCLVHHPEVSGVA